MKYLAEEKFRSQRGHLKYLQELRRLAIRNRHQSTPAEKVLWQKIKKFKPQFLRQKPINRFVLDFYCPKLLLDIEIDGDYHQKRINYDQGREEMLYSAGIKTIRFTNKQVLNHIDEVLIELEKVIRSRSLELSVNYSFS